MKKLIVCIILNIALFLQISPTVWAADLGCCEIRNVPNNGIILFTDKTDEECDSYKSINKHSIFHRYQQVAPDQKSCVEKNIAEQGKRLGSPIYFTPAVGVPSSDFVAGQPIEIQESTRTLANYIVAIFKYSLGVVGIIAAIALMVGGIIWLTASGNHERISSAKTIIGGGLAGLCIAFTAFLLLSLVNTNLVNLKITPVQKIAYEKLSYGCCAKTKIVNGVTEETAENLSEAQCLALESQGYDKIEYKKDLAAQDNKCVNLLGCCYVQANTHQFLFMEGRTVKEFCVNRTLETNCLNKNTSWLKEISAQGVGLQIADLGGQLLSGKNIFDIAADVDVEWHQSRCQEWDECEDLKIQETY